MEDKFNLKTLFPRYGETDLSQYNYIGDLIILSIFTIVFSIIGLAGDGYIVWLLGFRIRRKPLAIYILNLAVADFGSLLLLFPLNVYFFLLLLDEYLEFPDDLLILMISLFASMYNVCQLLLAAISTDRWVSVLFPNWYQCHWSPVVSTTMCAFIWALSFALFGVPFFLQVMDFIPDDFGILLVLAHIVTTLICLFIVMVSTLTLFTKVCRKSQQCQGRNLSKVILLMFLSFLLFTILSSCLLFIPFVIPAYFSLCISLKSSINPLIYFLAGRQNGGKFQEKMKGILQRVFKEERGTRMELQPCTQTVL